jgi:hypothetical protein
VWSRGHYSGVPELGTVNSIAIKDVELLEQLRDYQLIMKNSNQ